jgi:hypothetical protein
MGRVDVAKPGLVVATLLNFPLDYQGEIHITKSWEEPRKAHHRFCYNGLKTLLFFNLDAVHPILDHL